VSSKINISKIIKDHCDTLRHDHDQSVSSLDYFVFFGLPLIASGVLIYLNILLSKDVVGILITAFSVFAALLFNLLLLVYDIVKKRVDSGDKTSDRARLLKQIYGNIAYAILLSISETIVLVVFYPVQGKPVPERIIGYIIYFLSLNFILTLLMILKRVHVLLTREFEADS
jgi:hypothetical protein